LEIVLIKNKEIVMTNEEWHPPLMHVFALILLKPITQKRFLGGDYIRLYDYYGAIGFQYESGSIIGYTQRKKLNILEKLLGHPEKEGALIKILQDSAKRRLDNIQKQHGRKPDSFLELSRFIFEKEFNVKIVQEEIKNMKETFNKKVELNIAFEWLQWVGVEGIGFGSYFPELTEKMCRYHENIDIEEWTKVREYGLNIPEKPDFMSIDERKKSVLETLAAYVSESHPELLDPLELRNYLVTLQ